MKKIDGPLVSIVMPSHNSGLTIEDAIDSVRNGSYSNFEIIVVDDHSTDNTIQLVKKISKIDYRVKCIELKDKDRGASIARNVAIREAKGDYVAFLDSDDLWKKNKLKEQIRFMQKEGVDFCYSDYEYIDSDGKSKKIVRRCPNRMTYYRMLIGCSVGCLTVIYNAKKVGDIKIPNLAKRNDYALWCLILKRVRVGKKCPGVLAQYRRTGGSLSSGKKTSLIKYHYKMHRESNNFAPLVSVFFTATNVINYLSNVMFRDRKVK